MFPIILNHTTIETTNESIREERGFTKLLAFLMTGGEADELAPPQGPVYREAVIAREAYYATRLSWGFIPSLRTLSFFIPIFEDLSTVHQEIALTPPSRIVDAAMSSSDSDLHLYCRICLSLFLSDVEKEAQTVATTCGTYLYLINAHMLTIPRSYLPPRLCRRASEVPVPTAMRCLPEGLASQSQAAANAVYGL